MRLKNSITDVPGIEVGHAQDLEALTGCTVILCRDGATAGVDVRGGAPGTRETDLLSPTNLVQQVHAVLLAGGSAFGLAAADGVMRYLEEQKIGYETGFARVPIVPAAILYDLGVGRADIRPDAAMGYAACEDASARKVKEGSVGAGTGASVGKILGPKQPAKAGVGSASIHIGNGVVVGAIVAVNAFGDVHDPYSGKFLAGVRSKKKTLALMQTNFARTASPNNTVIGAVAINADFTKTEMTKIAQMAHDGLARAIRPAHTQFDGDTIFALSTGGPKVDLSTAGAFAAEVFAMAIVRAVKK